MNRNVRLGIFGIVAIAQLAVPAAMIFERENILQQGTLYRFRTQPVDPADPFRGRYVRIDVESSQAPIPKEWWPEPGETIYAVLGRDQEGFAVIANVQRKPPAGGDYIRAKTGWINHVEKTVAVRLPIDRYYMEEWSAPEAERAYWNSNRGDNRNTYVTVRVLDGEVTIEGLFIDGVPIEEYAKEKAATEGGNS